MARPARSFATGPVTHALLITSWAVLAIGVGAVAFRYDHLPATIPTHFGATGRPDGYGPRSAILALAAIWLLIQTLLTVLSRHPRLFNYPMPVTTENAQRVYREGERLLVWLGLALAVTFAGVLWSAGGAWTTGRVFIVVGLGGSLVALSVGLILLLRAGGGPVSTSSRDSPANRPPGE